MIFDPFFVFSDYELARLVVWAIKTQTDPITNPITKRKMQTL